MCCRYLWFHLSFILMGCWQAMSFSPLLRTCVAAQDLPQDLRLRCILLNLKSSNLLSKQKIKIIPVSMVSEFSSVQKWLTECRKNGTLTGSKMVIKKNGVGLTACPEQDQLPFVYWKELSCFHCCFFYLRSNV